MSCLQAEKSFERQELLFCVRSLPRCAEKFRLVHFSLGVLHFSLSIALRRPGRLPNQRQIMYLSIVDEWTTSQSDACFFVGVSPVAF